MFKEKCIKKTISILMILMIIFQALSPTLQCYATEDKYIENYELDESIDSQEINGFNNEDTNNYQLNVTDEEEKLLDNEIEKIVEEEISEDDENIVEDNFVVEDDEIIKENEQIIEEDKQVVEEDNGTIMEENNQVIQEENEITEEDELIIQEDELLMSNESDIMVLNGEFYVGNEAEFRNALANHADVIHVRQSIDFSAPVYINYTVRIVDESDDNSLRYGGGGNFITVQNGGSLVIDGMVINTNSSGVSGMTAINIEAGGYVTFVNSSIVDGGLGNTGILINNGGNLLLWSCKIVRCNLGINLQEGGNLMFATQEGRVNDFYWNKTAVFIDNFYGNCDFSQNISMHDNTEHAIYVANSNGNVNVMAGEYYNNTYCVRTANGTATVSGGSFHDNGWTIWCGGNLNLTGGDIYGNYYGVLTDEAYNGNFTMTGGNIHDNTAHAIQHQKENDGGCTITGGTISGDVFLEKNDNYVNTHSSYPSFTVTPSTYYFKRKLVRTTDNNTANSEINNVTLTPKDKWYMHVDNEYIVLWQEIKDKIHVTVKDDDTDMPLEDIKIVIIDEDGNIIEKLTTDENGETTSSDLPADKKYIVIQEETLDNYIKNDEEIDVDFIKEFGYEGDKTYTIDITNKHKKGDIELTKQDYDSNETLEGFEFDLYVKEVDKPYEEGQLIGTYTTPEEGKIVVKDLWTGTYYFKEKSSEASKYYKLIEDNIEVTIEADQTTAFVVKNEKQKGQIEINKKVSSTDSDITKLKTGSALKGAEFEIVDVEGNIVDTIITDENGYAKSNRLPIDRVYTIKEKLAPEYYLENERTETIEFKNDGEIVSLEWGNEAVYTQLEVDQTGIIETQANDLIRYDVTKLENKSNVKVDNFTFEDELPYEYSTLKSLYTGTYNYEKNYTVWYKIKDNDNWIQMLNKNAEDGTYNTQKNNYIDFSEISETIVSLKMDFGTVEADFSAKEDDMPFIFVKVKDTVENGDKWENRVKLTADYISNRDNVIHLEDDSNWETTSYAHKLEIKSDLKKNNNIKRDVLPKTGF